MLDRKRIQLEKAFYHSESPSMKNTLETEFVMLENLLREEKDIINILNEVRSQRNMLVNVMINRSSM